MASYCSNCGKSVTETATYCPNCGFQLKEIYSNNKTISNEKPQINNSKRMLFSIGIFFIVIIILVIYESVKDSKSTYNSKNKTESRFPNPSKSPTNSVEKKWYEGGTLHKATMREWKIATDENKLATCSDFIAKIRKDNGTPFNETEILSESYALKRCIDETQNNKSTETWKVIDMASSCLVLLGYK